MEGVEILSSTPIYNTFLPEWMGAIGFILTMVVFIVGIALICAEQYSWLILCGVLIAVTLVATVLGSTDNKNNIHHTEYKVIINDSVKMNDFVEYYEILDQEDKIYTVKERE